LISLIGSSNVSVHAGVISARIRNRLKCRNEQIDKLNILSEGIVIISVGEEGSDCVGGGGGGR
jgi:hypothetical protein